MGSGCHAHDAKASLPVPLMVTQGARCLPPTGSTAGSALVSPTPPLRNKETSTMDQRIQFIADYLSGRYSKKALCIHYGVSRPRGE